jgi:hypothetical protein
VLAGYGIGQGIGAKSRRHKASTETRAAVKFMEEGVGTPDKTGKGGTHRASNNDAVAFQTDIPCPIITQYSVKSNSVLRAVESGNHAA